LAIPRLVEPKLQPTTYQDAANADFIVQEKELLK
jgi:hypothetical protein